MDQTIFLIITGVLLAVAVVWLAVLTGVTVTRKGPTGPIGIPGPPSNSPGVPVYILYGLNADTTMYQANSVPIRFSRQIVPATGQSYYDPQSGTFTAPVTGMYNIELVVGALVTVPYINFAISVNDNVYAQTVTGAGSGTLNTNASLSTIVQLNKGDVLGITAYTNYGEQANTAGTVLHDVSFLSIFRI